MNLYENEERPPKAAISADPERRIQEGAYCQESQASNLVSLGLCVEDAQRSTKRG